MRPDVSPGDRRLLARPEFIAMFLDDLLNGGRKQLAAPIADLAGLGRGEEILRTMIAFWDSEGQRQRSTSRAQTN